MADLIQNANPKHNPITTIFGIVFLTIAVMMFVLEYFIPVYADLKGHKIEIPFALWSPIVPLGLGLLLLFINDDIFNRLFNRADKIAAKKTGTE